jgi:hypothetical protein
MSNEHNEDMLDGSIITEQRVKEIWSRPISDLVNVARSELRQVDTWIKATTLRNLRNELIAQGCTETLREYVVLISEHRFGSIETDQFLHNLNCYPEWMKD